MKRQDAGRHRSRFDHDTKEGMTVQASWEIEAIDIEGHVVPQLGIQIVLTGSNAYGVTGAIGNEKLAHEVIDNAIDAVRAYHTAKAGLTVPGKDVKITGYQIRQLNVLGDVDDRAFTVAVLSNAKQIITDMHARRALALPSTKLSKIEI